MYLRGSNVISDQSSYDLIYRDLIINNQLGVNDRYNLGTDSINRIYKAELISATVNFSGQIPDTVKNQCIILSIPQLNGITCKIAGSGTSNIFCQIPDNNTPLTPVITNNTISLLIGPHFYESIQFYNPPINKLNVLDVTWFDCYGNQLSTSETIKRY